MQHLTTSTGSLTGQFLIAMPAMEDPRFQRTLIYMCAHNEEGAMGLVVNRLFGTVTFADLVEQLDTTIATPANNQPVHYGGPVEAGRGFVLHSTDYVQEGTLMVNDKVALTATIDILRAISEKRGPQRNLLLLGYAGWGPGQLDAEIQANGWLTVPGDEDLLYDSKLTDKWQRAIGKLGFDLSKLSGEAGHA